jgi:hypothetical protein
LTTAIVSIVDRDINFEVQRHEPHRESRCRSALKKRVIAMPDHQERPPRGVLNLNVPSYNLATFWYVYMFYAPLVLVSHLMFSWILIKSRSWKK